MGEETLDQFLTRVAREVNYRNNINRKICVDDLEQYYPDNFEDAVEHAMMETMYWDDDLLTFYNYKV